MTSEGRVLDTASVAERLTVEVTGPDGQKSVTLEGIRSTASANDVAVMAMSSLKLPPSIKWDLRSEKTSRLLPPNQPIGAIAEETVPNVKVALQPDAGLA